jgi:hypothetical protein
VRDAVAFQEAEAALQDAVPYRGPADAAQVSGQVTTERAGIQAQDAREGPARAIPVLHGTSAHRRSRRVEQLQPRT